MFFWQIERLKEQLVERPLSSRGELPYLIAYVALSTIGLYFPHPNGDVPAFVDAVVVTTITVAGSLYAYRQNAAGDASFFLQRYFSIGWVVGVRFAAVVLGIFAVYAVVLAITGRDISEHTRWYESVFWWLAEVVFFHRLGVHTGDVARRANAL